MGRNICKPQVTWGMHSRIFGMEKCVTPDVSNSEPETSNCRIHQFSLQRIMYFWVFGFRIQSEITCVLFTHGWTPSVSDQSVTRRLPSQEHTRWRIHTPWDTGFSRRWRRHNPEQELHQPYCGWNLEPRDVCASSQTTDAKWSVRQPEWAYLL